MGHGVPEKTLDKVASSKLSAKTKLGVVWMKVQFDTDPPQYKVTNAIVRSVITALAMTTGLATR